MICMSVLLLVLGLCRLIHAQPNCSHLPREVVHILIALVLMLALQRRLVREITFLLDWRAILRWCAGVLIRRLGHGRAARLLVARRARSDWWAPFVGLVWPAGSIRVWRARAEGVVCGEVRHGRGAGMLRWIRRTGRFEAGQACGGGTTGRGMVLEMFISWGEHAGGIWAQAKGQISKYQG